MAKPHELREKGLRLTPQRELVLQAVRQLGHAIPEEVAEKVRSTHPGINLSTVYRNLETLENVGLVLHTHQSAKWRPYQDLTQLARRSFCFTSRAFVLIIFFSALCA